MIDEDLSRAYEELVAARAPADRTACVSPEALMDVVARRGPEPERLAVVNHALGCALCRQELELLRRAANAAQPTTRPRWLVPAIAAALISAVAIGVWRRNPPDVLRGSRSTTIPIAPIGAVPSPASFVWHAVPGAISYEVVVATAAGERIADSTTTDTTLVIPVTSRADLYWLVRARSADGTDRPTRPTRFRITP